MVTFPDQLTPSQRKLGRDRYVRFLSLNGISVTFLMENVLILYAIRNGLPDPAVAVMASFMFLTMPFMIVGQKLVSRYGLARTWGLCWALRYFCVLPLAAAPFFAYTGIPYAVAAAILAGSFGLFSFRSMGMICNTPLMGEITTPDNRGKLISRGWLRFNISYLLSMIAVIALLRASDRTGTFQLIILAGALVGLYTSRVLTTIPESDMPRQSARKPAFHAFLGIMKSPRYRRLLAAWSAGLAAIVIVNPVTMIALKNGYGVSDYNALIFSLVGIMGGATAAFVSGVVSDQVGPRPLVILFMSMLILVAVFWAFAPTELVVAAVGLAFFCGGFALVGIQVGIAHYFLSATPQERRVGASLFMQMISGAITGLVGSVGSGGLLRVLESSMGEGLHIYRWYFRIVCITLVGLLFIICRLDRLREWRIQNILGLFFSFRDVRALFALSRMHSASDFQDDVRQVRKLAWIGSSVSEKALLEYLDSSRLAVRARALQALRQIDFGPRTVDAMLYELQNNEFTTAWIAAEALGEHGIKEAIPYLRKGLQSEDVFLQGKCMVALARLEDTESYDTIREIMIASDNPRLVIHGAEASAIIGGCSVLPLLLEKLTPTLRTAVLDELLNAIADLCGHGEGFYRAMKLYNRDASLGLESFFEQLEPAKDKKWVGLLKAWAQDTGSAEDALAALKQAAAHSSSPCADALKRHIQNFSPNRLTCKTALCFALILGASDESREACPSSP